VLTFCHCWWFQWYEIYLYHQHKVVEWFSDIPYISTGQ
jgi:hypothetical protein